MARDRRRGRRDILPWSLGGAIPPSATVLESQILDGSILARLAANETVSGDWTFTGTTTVPQATVTAHQAALNISETQIPNGSLLARVGDNETITGDWTFSGTTVIPRATVTAHQAALAIDWSQLTNIPSTFPPESHAHAESDIVDGSILARVAGSETITGLYTFSHASGLLTNVIGERTAAAGVTIDGLLIKDAGIPEAAVTAHQAALTILESQITDGSILARLTADETVTGNWTLSGKVNISRPVSQIQQVLDNSAIRSLDIDWPNISSVGGQLRLGRITNTTDQSNSGLFVHTFQNSGARAHQLTADGNASLGIGGGTISLATTTIGGDPGGSEALRINGAIRWTAAATHHGTLSSINDTEIQRSGVRKALFANTEISLHPSGGTEKLNLNGTRLRVVDQIRVGTDTTLSSDKGVYVLDSSTTQVAIGEDGNNFGGFRWDTSNDRLEFFVADGGAAVEVAGFDEDGIRLEVDTVVDGALDVGSFAGGSASNNNSGTQNAWAVGENMFITWQGDTMGNLTVNGIAGGRDGRVLIVRIGPGAAGTFTLTFNHENVSASANDRLSLGTGASPITLSAAGDCVMFVYDGVVDNRWILVNVEP